MIIFELLPGIGDMIKKRRCEIEFDGGTFAQAIAALIEAQPELADDLLDSEGDIKGALATFINDQRAPREERSRLELKDGDRVTILPPLFGG
jgi:molybdopterin synthase sulfur carrier subunit